MNAISRRDLLLSFFRRSRETSDDPSPSETPVSFGAPSEEVPQLALILDRFCLAWQGSFCSVCVERCPEPGAILTDKGKPRVNPDLCTGCQLCHDVCPAPKNAVFLVARKARPGMIGRTVLETAPPPADQPA
jgi:ferredoxin